MQSAFVAPISGGTASATYAAAQIAGDTNIVVVGWNDSLSQVGSVSDSAGNNYVLAVGPTVNSGNATQLIYYAPNIAAAAAGTNIVTVTFSTAVANPDLRILEYSGLNTTNPLDVAVGASGTGAALSSGSIATTNANDLLVGGNYIGAKFGSVGSGYTQRLVTTPDGDLVEDQVVTATGSYSATSTQSPSSWWVMQLAAFRAAGSGGGSTPPTAPGNLSATAVSSSQVNLSWTASTDSAGVSGYLIERCLGAGCTSFILIGTSLTTTYSDSGLAAATSYSYRVRADDENGNLSAYSNTVSVTTSAGSSSSSSSSGGSSSSGSSSGASSSSSSSSSGSSGGASSSGSGSLTISPRNAALTLSQTQQFTTSAPGGTTLAWSVDGISGGNSTVGVINSSGLYTPPATAGTHTVSVSYAGSNTATAAVAVTDLSGVAVYHYDLARTGQNLHEYALTPSTVASGNFGKRWSCPLDGTAYAQPLYIPNLSINGGTHNVLIVATMHDTVYAFDADNPNCVTYWKRSFINPPAITTTTSSTADCGDVTLEYGINGTPALDPVAQTLYLVANTTESGTVIQRLHALNLLTGADRTNSPVVIQASVPGTGDGGSTVSFNAFNQNQRLALTLNNGGVIVGFSSHCDDNVWHGWLMRYNATTLAQTAVFNSTPNGVEGGIWMAGGAPAFDSEGNMFLSTGNGTFDNTSSKLPPVAPNNDFGESFLNLNPTSLTVQDFYTPSQNAAWSEADQDISSAGVTVLPDGTGPAGHPNVLVGSDKQAHLWLIDRTNMSGFFANADKTVQYLTLPNAAGCTSLDGQCVYSTAAYYNGTLYLGEEWAPMIAVQLTGGLIPANSQQIVIQSSQSSETYGYPSPTPVISASPSGNGLVWALQNWASGTDNGAAALGPAILRVYNADNLGTTLYSSDARAADTGGNAAKFTQPIVANGHVYIAGTGSLTVYGLAP